MENLVFALKPLGESLSKVEYWNPENPNSEIGSIKILAENALDLLKSFGASALDVLIEAYLDDTDFDPQIGQSQPSQITKSKNIPRHLLIKSYKLIKDQRLRQEIELYGPLALQKITEKIHEYNHKDPQYQKLLPIYEKLQSNFSIKSSLGYNILM